MIRRPPRSTRVRSSAASDVYKRQTLACIEDERTAPASSEEIEEGKEEQVQVEYSLVPVEILGGGVASGVKFQRCTLGEPNERGWRPPVPVEGEYVELSGDTVIFAVGQAIVDDFTAGADGVAVERGQIGVDPDTMMTGRGGVARRTTWEE